MNTFKVDGLTRALTRPSGPSPRGGGSPKKGLIRNIKIFPELSENFRVLKLRSFTFSGGPGRFREVR